MPQTDLINVLVHASNSTEVTGDIVTRESLKAGERQAASAVIVRRR